MPKYYEKGEKPVFKKYKKSLGVLLILLGLLIFAYFIFPIVSYQIFLANFIQSNIEFPIPKDMIRRDNAIGSLVESGINSLTRDYTDARNWYPQVTPRISTKTQVDSYLISIPKLKIENAEVSTQDYDLDKHLIQYLGTAIPGEEGTAVIFGHSTLPSLFNPKNYKTIFATAHTLKVGDEFSATVGDVTYQYKIFSITITSSEDTNILSQGYDRSYVTLVTCTPPGTIWKRLVIRAALENAVSS